MNPKTAPKRILIVSHNAGGAAVLAAWVAQHLNPDDCHFVLNGPALGLFLQVFKRLFLVPLSVHVSAYSQVITATSAQDTQWETLIIQRAKQQAVPVTSLLDHWTNYQSRFLLNSRYCYPDAIWVQDTYALAITQTLPNYPPVSLVPNDYLQQQVAAIKALTPSPTPSATVHILFVAEPSTHPDYTDTQILQQVLQYLTANLQQPFIFRLRLHPRQPPQHYAAVLAECPPQVQWHISQNTLIEDCAWSHWVMGCQTMAMVVALAAGIKVSCCLPAFIAACALPHSGIERLFPYVPNP